MEEKKKIRSSGVLQPNTTQVPHIIIREWMPLLKDVELRVLLVVTDQTLGWSADDESGRRKERDWISRSQLIAKTGRAGKAVSCALSGLIEQHNIVEAVNQNGELLDTAEKRQRNYGKIYYRLKLAHPVRVSKGHTGKTRPRRVSKEQGKKDTLQKKLVTKYPFTPQSGDVDKIKSRKTERTNHRAEGMSPRALGTNPRAVKKRAKQALQQEWLEAVEKCQHGCRDGIREVDGMASYCLCVENIMRRRDGRDPPD